MKGTFVVQGIRQGVEVARWEAPNLITAAGMHAVANTLLNIGGFGGGLTYVALGTSSTAPTTADLRLGAEAARRRFDIRERAIGNSALFYAYFPNSTIPTSIQEMGVFGYGATDTVNTGQLFAHVLIAISVGANVDLSVTYVLEVS